MVARWKKAVLLQYESTAIDERYILHVCHGSNHRLKVDEVKVAYGMPASKPA